MKERFITKRKDGTYQVRFVKAVTDPITRKREDIVRKRSGITTLGQARYVRSQLVIEVQAAYEDRIRGVSTVGQAIDQFFEMRGHQFSPASIMGMRHNFEQYLGSLKDTHVTKITRSQVEDLLQVNIGRVTPATLDRVASNIRALFRFLLERGAVKENPAQFVRFGSKKTYDRQLKAMSQGEIKKLLTEAQDHPFFPILFVAYHTGARTGELTELKFMDFDFENETLTISRSQCKKTKVIKPPKNGRSRTFHVNKELIALVKALKLRAGDSEYVLPREKQFMRGEGARVLKELQKDLGIQPTNFHSIRASFITHLLLAGVPITTVQHIVGHADLKTTQQYVRLCGSDLVGATDSLQRHSPSQIDAYSERKVLPFEPKVIATGTVQPKF